MPLSEKYFRLRLDVKIKIKILEVLIRVWARGVMVQDWVAPAIILYWKHVIPLHSSVHWVVNHQLSIHELPEKPRELNPPFSFLGFLITNHSRGDFKRSIVAAVCVRSRWVTQPTNSRLGPPGAAHVAASLSRALAFSGYWVCRRTGPCVYPLHLLRQAGSSCWHEWTGLSIMQEELRGERLRLPEDHYLSNCPA